jgi:hypothetical protein
VRLLILLVALAGCEAIDQDGGKFKPGDVVSLPAGQIVTVVYRRSGGFYSVRFANGNTGTASEAEMQK